MDNYIEFLQETLISEVSMNNLSLESLNEEGGIASKVKDAVKWIVKQISNLINFITNTVLNVLNKAMGIFRKKSTNPQNEPQKMLAAPKEFTVPKAVGFANDVTNNLSKDKIISLCHSKNDRTGEIKQRQAQIVERCQNARKLNMTRKVGIDEFNRLKSKSAADIERATVHIKSIQDALKSLEHEFQKIYLEDEDNSKLKENATKGNQRAIEYVLNYLGYQPEQSINVKNGDININITGDEND